MSDTLTHYQAYIEELEKVLLMWVDFYQAGFEEGEFVDDALLAEEAMQATLDLFEKYAKDE
jgi:hypothetical protein